MTVQTRASCAIEWCVLDHGHAGGHSPIRRRTDRPYTLAEIRDVITQTEVCCVSHHVEAIMCQFTGHDWQPHRWEDGERECSRCFAVAPDGVDE